MPQATQVQTSQPIPVYQRPAEFYSQYAAQTTQQAEASQAKVVSGGAGGKRRGAVAGGMGDPRGVDFSNLILLTRGGKSYGRSSTPSTEVACL